MRAGQSDQEQIYTPWLPQGETAYDWHVLGESHYISPDDPDSYLNSPSLTQEVVRDWALGETGSAFFTRVAAIIENKQPGTFERSAACHHFAYSNYVQTPLDGPRIAPSAAQWADASRRFVALLKMTRPNVLVVLGSRLWNQLPGDFGALLPKFAFEVEMDWPPVADAWFYPYWADGQLYGTVAVKVVHPSAGFGRWNWQVAAERAHTAFHCHSNLLEYARDHLPIE